MRIDGSFSAEMSGLRFSYTEASKLRLAHVQICKRVDRDECKKLFGDEFAALAFASMVEAGGGEGDVESKSVRFAYKSMTPDLTCEVHQLEIVGKNGMTVQPVVMKLAPVEKEPEVDVIVELPISIGENAELGGLLATKFKTIVEVKLEASQLALPGVVIKRAGAFGNPVGTVVSQ